MNNRVLTLILGVGLLLVAGASVKATVEEETLPFNNLTIEARGTTADGYWGLFNWYSDGDDTTTISGAVNELTIDEGDAALKIGFGEYDGKRGCLVFYAESGGSRHVALEYSTGTMYDTKSLASFSNNAPPVYTFTITANETDGTFSATVTDDNPANMGYDARIQCLTGGSSHDITNIQMSLFAVGVSNIDQQDKLGVNANVDLVPEPCTLLLIGLGAGVLRYRRRR